MNKKMQKTKDILSAMVAERSLKRREFFKTYTPPQASRVPEGESFSPLPSDLIKDPGMWPEWKLEGYQVVKV